MLNRTSHAVVITFAIGGGDHGGGRRDARPPRCRTRSPIRTRPARAGASCRPAGRTATPARCTWTRAASSGSPTSARAPRVPGRTDDPILAFDPSGRLLRSFGSGLFVFPHGIHVDGDGNVWVTDGQGAEGKGHQVFKFSPEGKVLLTLGTAGVAGTTPDDVQPAKRRRGGRERRHLRRRRPRRRVQREDREVLEGRQVHQDLGPEGHRPG